MIEIRTTAVTIDGNLLLLTIPTVDLTANEEYFIRICQDIPEGSGVKRVKIKYNGEEIDFRVLTGNYVRADQIKTRKRYLVVYGNSPEHFSMRCLLPISCYQATQE